MAGVYREFIRETATWQEYTETLLGRKQHGRSIQRLYYGDSNTAGVYRDFIRETAT